MPPIEQETVISLIIQTALGLCLDRVVVHRENWVFDEVYTVTSLFPSTKRQSLY